MCERVHGSGLLQPDQPLGLVQHWLCQQVHLHQQSGCLGRAVLLMPSSSTLRRGAQAGTCCQWQREACDALPETAQTGTKSRHLPPACSLAAGPAWPGLCLARLCSQEQQSHAHWRRTHHCCCPGPQRLSAGPAPAWEGLPAAAAAALSMLQSGGRPSRGVGHLQAAGAAPPCRRPQLQLPPQLSLAPPARGSGRLQKVARRVGARKRRLMMHAAACLLPRDQHAAA